MSDERDERGQVSRFDRRSGEVRGSGSGSGGGNPGEDYDQDPVAGGGVEPLGKGHPLPASEEARHGEIPEGLAEEKGRGDDPKPAVQPDGDPVNPDGEPYRYDDIGRAERVHGAPRR